MLMPVYAQTVQPTSKGSRGGGRGSGRGGGRGGGCGGGRGGGKGGKRKKAMDTETEDAEPPKKRARGKKKANPRGAVDQVRKGIESESEGGSERHESQDESEKSTSGVTSDNSDDDMWETLFPFLCHPQY